ncbi:MAG: thioredoxin family protein [Sulfuricella sp.]|jgi:thioredoxin 1|nr:thioredoxin family protein [Sulfuricella sp.]
MYKFHKAVTIFALVVAATLVSRAGAVETTTSAPVGKVASPRLVDLGAGKCIPCKQMAPILEQLRSEYAGRFDVTFIDVWTAPEAANPYRIRVIPTQIFFDANGKELFRHEGFYSREQILGKWRELGFAFAGAGRAR